MYKIYVNKTLIYHGASESLHLLKGTITHELNKSSTFDFTILQDHPHYDKFQRLKDIVTVYSDDKIKFKGRILEDKSDFRNNKNIKCEGELSFLTDILIRPYSFTGTPEELFKKFINEYNAQADASRQFVVGEVTVTDPNNYIVRESSDIKDAWTNIKEKLVDMLGGYVYISGYTEDGKGIINYFDDMPYICNQTIKFGENLLDFARGNTASSIGTVLIPYGAKPEGSDTRIDIKSVNNGLDYIVDEEAVAKYGRIERTNTWDDVTEPSNLLRKAKAYLASIILTNITLELSAVDLSLLNSSMDQFNYGCYIPIKSAPHNVDALFLLSKQTIDLLRPDNDKITLGTTRNSFTGESLNSTNKIDMVEKIVSDYKVNEPIITEIVNKLTVEITRNLPLTQTYDPTTDSYTPDYTSTPLILTPIATFRENAVNCSYIWKRVENGVEKALNSYETVSSDGTLTISQNLNSDFSVYKCYATYQNGEITQVDNATAEVYLLNNGASGTGIGSITRQFYLSTSKTTQSGGSWVTTMPTWSIGKYLWTRLQIVYTNPSSTVYTTPECDSSWEAVNDIEVGGRNLFENSGALTSKGIGSHSCPVMTITTDESIDTPSGQYLSIELSVDESKTYTGGPYLTDVLGNYISKMIKGEKYTVSVWVKCSTNKTTGVFNAEFLSNITYKLAPNLSTEWQRYVITGTYNGNVGNSVAITFYYGPSWTDGDIFYLSSPKVEKGNKATDWTLAPEDIGEVIQSATAPTNTNKTWLDTSVTPPLLKQWNGEEWIVVNDPTEALESLRGALINSIEQTSDSILMTVGEQYFLKNEAETLVSDVNTQFEQTKSSFEMRFTNFQTDLETLNSNTNTEFENIKKYIRFEDGNIVLGEVGNQLTLKITNEKISFLQAGSEVAYFSNQKLYVTDADFINSLQIGKFAFIPRANGSLDFKKVG